MNDEEAYSGWRFGPITCITVHVACSTEEDMLIVNGPWLYDCGYCTDLQRQRVSNSVTAFSLSKDIIKRERDNQSPHNWPVLGSWQHPWKLDTYLTYTLYKSTKTGSRMYQKQLMNKRNFIENLQRMFSVYYMYRDVCNKFKPMILHQKG